MGRYWNGESGEQRRLVWRGILNRLRDGQWHTPSFCVTKAERSPKGRLETLVRNGFVEKAHPRSFDVRYRLTAAGRRWLRAAEIATHATVE
jgi:hypothetical protein